MTTTSATQVKYNDLSLQLTKIRNYKWFLNLEDSECEFVLSDLEREVEELCFMNFNELLSFQYYLTQIPSHMKNRINEVVNSVGNTKMCRKLYLRYLDDLKNNIDFQEYQTFIYFHRGEELYNYLYNSKESINEDNFQKIRSNIIQRRKLHLSLIYNILSNDLTQFVKRDFAENLPQLFLWIKNNLKTPIKNLTNDDCKIIISLISGMTYDDMLESIDFSYLIKDYASIDKCIKKLPGKLSVQNLTQAMFKIILLKPHVWQQINSESIVKSIKGVCNAQK